MCVCVCVCMCVCVCLPNLLYVQDAVLGQFLRSFTSFNPDFSFLRPVAIPKLKTPTQTIKSSLNVE